MSRKKSQPEPESLPAADPAAWPKSTETRSLPCKLAPTELAEKSDEMARHQLDANRIESEKKSANSHFKAQLDSKTADINRLAHVVSDRAEFRNVKCEWRYEQSGFDADRQIVFHPEKKTLVRLDTGEAVEIRHIEDHERQMKLNLEEKAKAETEPPFQGNSEASEEAA